MTRRELYLGMAKWYESYEFTPAYGEGTCGCFLHAKAEVGAGEFSYVGNELGEVVGVTSFGTDDLIDSGWTHGCTDDARAACLIAADLAAP